MFLAERSQNCDTLSQAWANGIWGMEWSIVHHNEYSIEGSGAKGTGDKKGKKRPREDEWGADSDRNLQSRVDSAIAKYAKLLKTNKKGKRHKGPWDDGHSEKDWFEKPHGYGDKGKGKKSGKKK